MNATIVKVSDVFGIAGSVGGMELGDFIFQRQQRHTLAKVAPKVRTASDLVDMAWSESPMAVAYVYASLPTEKAKLLMDTITACKAKLANRPRIKKPFGDQKFKL